MAEKLRLAARYLSARHSTTLNILLPLTRNNPIAFWDHTVNPRAADAILVDIDGPEGQSLIAELDAEKRYVLIACGESPRDLPGSVLFLQKPFVPATLLSILEQAARLRLNITPSDPPARSRPAVDRNRPVVAGSQRIIDLLADQVDIILGIAHDSLSPYVLIFDKKRRCYYQDGSIIDAQGALLSAVRSYQRVEEVSREQLVMVTKSLIVADLDPVLWKAGLSASNGVLYSGLPESGYYKLRYWPDLKKLGFSIAHMKIASVLRQGGVISSIAGMTHLPIEEIINFINVCYILNYLEPVGVGLAASNSFMLGKGEKDSEATRQKRSLLSRIRSRLGL